MDSRSPIVARTGRHRSDIDGLRCLAVLLVVGFHINPRALSGGFVGVDVFFVISGYLITGILLRDLAAERFSISNFYLRRVRRIAPALITVLAACTLLAYYFLLPADLVSYAKSLFAAVFSYSNFYFWTQSGYFAPKYAQLLLHTWSLAVEEQFYLVLPWALWLLSRRPSWLRPALFITAMASLAISTVLSHIKPAAAFYAPYSRAWELLAGSLAVVMPIAYGHRRWLREVVAILGLAAILYSACSLLPGATFPGVAALLPCLGSVALLSSGEEGGTMVFHLLSVQPFTFIGLISYSVYLIHWPLLLLVRMGAFPRISSFGKTGELMIMCLSLVLGYISWKFVEEPFRSGRFKNVSRRQLFSAVGATAGLLAVAAVLDIGMRGFPSRFPPGSVVVANYLDEDLQMRTGTCFISFDNRFDANFRAGICATLSPGQPNYLLVGDSHAGDLLFGLEHAMPGAHFLQITAASCLAVQGNYDHTNCGELRRYLYQQFLPSHHVNAVILGERWGGRSDLRQLASTVHWYQRHGIKLILVGPVQEYDVPLPLLLSLAIKDHDAALPARHELPESRRIDIALAGRAHAWNVPYLSPWHAICSAGECAQYVDSHQLVPTMEDDNHLTREGSYEVAHSWVQNHQLP